MSITLPAAREVLHLTTMDRYKDFHHDPRSDYIKKLGFVLLTKELIERLVHSLEGMKVLDAGAGSGYLSKCLHDRGVNIEAVDNLSQEYKFQVGRYFPVENESAVARVKRRYYDVVLLSWPDYSTPFAFDVASALKQTQQLLYCGEGEWGCTGDDKFHELLCTDYYHKQEISDYLNEVQLQFWAIHDYWHWYERR